MIRCTKCGTINAADAVFCSNCASYLEWTGERVAADEAPKNPSDPPPQPQPEPPPPQPQPEPPPPPQQVEPPRPTQPQPAVERPAIPTPHPTLPPPQPTPPPPAGTPTPAPPPPEPAKREPAKPEAPPLPQPPPPRPPAPAAKPEPPSFRFRAVPTPPAFQQRPPSGPAPREPSAQPGPVHPTIAPQPPPRQPTATQQPPERRPTTTALPRSRPRPTQPVPVPEPPLKPGDLVCAVCGAGNGPDRRFCRRCGNSLASAVVAVKPPWYRRLFGRNRRAVAAGYRPRSMGVSGQPRPSRVKRVVLLVLLLVIAAPIVGYFTVPAVRTAIDRAIGDARVAFELSQHGASNAYDDSATSFWLADTTGATRPVLKVPIEATELGSLIFHGGATTSPDTFDDYARPRQIEVVLPGISQTEIFELDDSAAAQEVCLRNVQTVREFDVRILSFYSPAPAVSRPLVALRELDFKSGRCP